MSVNRATAAMSEVIGVSFVTSVSSAVNQPTKVYPAFAGFSGRTGFWPFSTYCVMTSSLPSSPSTVNVRVKKVLPVMTLETRLFRPSIPSAIASTGITCRIISIAISIAMNLFIFAIAIPPSFFSNSFAIGWRTDYA